MEKDDIETTSKGIAKATHAEPIKDLNDIAKIKAVLNKPKTKKYYVLFMTGIYVGLRISDLLRLKVKDVQTGYVRMHETKTRKAKDFVINPKLLPLLHAWIAEQKLKEDDFIFFANRKDGTKNKAIDKSQAFRKIREAVREAGVDIHYSNHTLRKTCAHHAYKNNGEDLTKIQYLLNHSSQAVTMRYIGLDQESIDETLNNLDFEI